MKPIKIKTTKELVKKVPAAKRKTSLSDVRRIKDDAMCLSLIARATGDLHKCEAYMTENVKRNPDFVFWLEGIAIALREMDPVHEEFLISLRSKERNETNE